MATTETTEQVRRARRNRCRPRKGQPLRPGPQPGRQQPVAVARAMRTGNCQTRRGQHVPAAQEEFGPTWPGLRPVRRQGASDPAQGPPAWARGGIRVVARMRQGDGRIHPRRSRWNRPHKTLSSPPRCVKGLRRGTRRPTRAISRGRRRRRRHQTSFSHLLSAEVAGRRPPAQHAKPKLQTNARLTQR